MSLGPDVLVLHGLRVKGWADSTALARCTGLGGVLVEELLAQGAEEGLVAWSGGAFPRWSLTDAGRAAAAAAVAVEMAAPGVGDAVALAYRTFCTVNADLLEACTAWQLREGAPNDHADAGYDAACVARLRRVDLVVQPSCRRLATTVARYGVYGRRLGAARAQVEAGRREWFTAPAVDSYHTVWFELHEDFLASLGLERGSGA